TFTPAGGLAQSTQYFVLASVADLTGQSLFVGSRFTTVSPGDTVAPTVVAVSTPNGSTGVPVNAPVVVRLSEPVGMASVGSNAIGLSRGEAAVPGGISE